MPSSKNSSTAQHLQPQPPPWLQIYSHLHPIIILSALALLFHTLVQDPLSTLSQSLPPLALLQTSILYQPRHDSLTTTLLASLIPLILTFSLGTPLITTMMILLGAPITTHLLHTSLVAAHISLLALYPLIYLHGLDFEKWRRIIAGISSRDDGGSYGTAIGTVVGAWLGAVPIPLDWDREWQRWPVTIVTGAYIGYFAGAYLGRFFMKGKGKDV